MKKALSLLLAGVMCIGLLAGCGGQNTEDTQGSGSTPDTSSTQETGNKTIDTLRIAFVPSREPEEIITATEPLKQMLTDELAKLGYDVGEVDITVGTSYEAVGEALSAGTADVGLIPGGTYVLYDDGCDVLLTATREEGEDIAQRFTQHPDRIYNGVLGILLSDPEKRGETH